ncbi:MAG TPA: hypothetical protein VHZ03_57370 [Trebonia sp.]|nr:hypothetical protein [Trebonia sp.]
MPAARPITRVINWSATTSSSHVIYESPLELARLLLADFDSDVAAIAAQLFLLRAPADRG